jgi:sec-independent protein translocase protein TatC
MQLHNKDFIRKIMSATPGDMPLQGHLIEFRSRIIRAVAAIIIVTLFTASFGIHSVVFSGYNIYYPFPDPLHNISVQLTYYMRDTLLPEHVQLIQTAPGQAFFAQIYVSLLIGVIISIPIITKEIVGFISPAIEHKEKKKRILSVSVFLPMIALFIGGALFSYVLVIPFVLEFLYNYGQAIGVATFFNINEFISFVLQFLIGIGIAFELPVFMYAISLTGITDASFWRKNFRYAIIVFVIFGAVITPDGSGITMWLMTGPMIALYLVGLAVIERKQRKRRTELQVQTKEV